MNDSQEKNYGGTLENLLLRYTTNTEDDGKIVSGNIYIRIYTDLLYKPVYHAEVYSPELRTTMAGKFTETSQNKLPTLDVAPLKPKWGRFHGEAWGEP